MKKVAILEVVEDIPQTAVDAMTEEWNKIMKEMGADIKLFVVPGMFKVIDLEEPS